MPETRPLPPFWLERYLAPREFSTRHMLCGSDSESLTVKQALELASEEGRALWDNMNLMYTPTQGSLFLREAVARHYAGVGAEQVMVSSPQDCIFAAMGALLEQLSGAVIVTYPGYQSLYELADCRNRPVLRWEPRSDGAEEPLTFYLADLERLFDEAEEKGHAAQLLVVNFPHNPTGYMPTREEWRRIVEIAESRGAVLFSDEMYRGLEMDPSDRLSSAVEVYKRAITLSGVSKNLGMPGARMGWVVTHMPEVIARALEIKDYTTICSPPPSEVLAYIALEAAETILEERRCIIRENLKYMESWSKRWGHVLTWHSPRAGTIAFPTLQEQCGDADQFCARALEEAGVLLLPGTVYDFEPGNRRVRFGFGRRSFREGMEALTRMLEKMHAQS